MEMSLSEALGLVKQMGSFYKAFKKIEEVLLAAVQAEQLLRELEAKRAQVQIGTDAVKRWRDELHVMVARLEEEVKEKESRLAAINAELGSRVG